MESKWMSSCVKSVVHTIPAHYLAASTNIFSDSFICQLGRNLESHREQLARELGFPASFKEAEVFYRLQVTAKRQWIKTHTATDGLYSWCNNSGSTIFVLVSVLGSLCRTDCVQMIEQYIQSQTMQLFVKVDQAATEGQPGAPKFHQIITCCEFSLLQALENVLGSDLVYYEIVGPGAWVMWTTQAKELKGQQLTLAYHSQPVSSTRAALCDPMEQETELKQLEITHNPAAESEDETHLKVLECTQIDTLKYSHEPSIQVSNSNNLTLSNSLNAEKASPRSLSVEGPTKTYSALSADSKNYHFSLDGQTHVKTLVVDTQNTPGVPVIKYFPDKLLYEDSPNKKNNQCVEANQAHPQQILDNVPRLSLLENDFPSLSPDTQTMAAQPVQVVQQGKFNDLSCVVVPSFGKQSVDSQTFHKSSVHENVRSNNVSGQTGKPSLMESHSNIPTDHDLANQIPVLSEINVCELDMSSAASSLFAQGYPSRFFDTPISCAGNGYLPHTCIKTFGENLENRGSTVENCNPVPCGNCGQMTTTAQVQNKLLPASLTFSQQQDDHHQVQQQHLLDVTEMKSKHLWLQKLQRQQALTLPQISPLNSGLDSLADCSSLDLLPEEMFHQDTDVYQDPQQHTAETSHTSSHHTGMYHPQGMDHEDFHLSDMSQLDTDQQQNPLYSEQEVQPVISPYLKPNASRYLICHTPPPGFPDEQTHDNQHHDHRHHDNHHQESEAKGKYILPQSSISSPAGEELSESGQFLDKLSQMTNVDTGSEQYIAMCQPIVHDVGGHASFKVSSVMSQSSLGHPSTLQNTEFSSNMLPVQNISQHPRNQMKSVVSSDSSGGSSECPVFIYSQPFTVFTEGQSSFRTAKPFHPAPLVLDALGRPINASMPNNHMFRASFGASGQAHQDGCYPMSSRQTHPDRCYPISSGQLIRSKSLPISHFQTKSLVQTRSMEVQPHVENLEVELLSLDGWNPYVNGDTIQETMDKFKSPDGNYIIWKSRRHKNFVISVSYLNQLFHFRVEELTSQNNGRTVYFLFEGGYSSESLLDLIQHYLQNGIRISMQSAGKKKMYIENIHLLRPLQMNSQMISQMIRMGTSKSK